MTFHGLEVPDGTVVLAYVFPDLERGIPEHYMLYKAATDELVRGIPDDDGLKIMPYLNLKIEE